MKVIKIDVTEGPYCFECDMPDKFLVNLTDSLLCLDCLDKAMKMILTEIENDNKVQR